MTDTSKVIIDFNSKIIDPGENFNKPITFTAPVDGTYCIEYKESYGISTCNTMDCEELSFKVTLLEEGEKPNTTEGE